MPVPVCLTDLLLLNLADIGAPSHTAADSGPARDQLEGLRRQCGESGEATLVSVPAHSQETHQQGGSSHTHQNGILGIVANIHVYTEPTFPNSV